MLSFWRSSRQIHLGKDPGVEQELAEEIMFPIWPGNTLESHQKGLESSTEKRILTHKMLLIAHINCRVIYLHILVICFPRLSDDHHFEM